MKKKKRKNKILKTMKEMGWNEAPDSFNFIHKQLKNFLIEIPPEQKIQAATFLVFQTVIQVCEDNEKEAFGLLRDAIQMVIKLYEDSKQIAEEIYEKEKTQNEKKT